MFMRQNTRKKIPSAILAISSTWNILLSITEYSFCCFPFATLTCTESSLDPDFVPESESESCSVVSDSFRPHELYSPWNSPGQDTGMGSLSLLQGIFPTQGSNPGLPHCRWILYQLSHKGSPRILGWVAYLFTSGSSQPRNRAGVSWTAGGFLTNWATRKAPQNQRQHQQGGSLEHPLCHPLSLGPGRGCTLIEVAPHPDRACIADEWDSPRVKGANR